MAASDHHQRLSLGLKLALLPPVRAGVCADPDWMAGLAVAAETLGFAPGRRLPRPRPPRHPGRGHDLHRARHRGLRPPRPPPRRPGQAARHRRPALEGPAPALRRGGLDGGGAEAGGIDFASRGRRADESIDSSGPSGPTPVRTGLLLRGVLPVRPGPLLPQAGPGRGDPRPHREPLGRLPAPGRGRGGRSGPGRPRAHPGGTADPGGAGRGGGGRRPRGPPPRPGLPRGRPGRGPGGTGGCRRARRAPSRAGDRRVG